MTHDIHPEAWPVANTVFIGWGFRGFASRSDADDSGNPLLMHRSAGVTGSFQKQSIQRET